MLHSQHLSIRTLASLFYFILIFVRNSQFFRHYLFRYLLRANHLVPLSKPLPCSNQALCIGLGIVPWLMDETCQHPGFHWHGLELLLPTRNCSLLSAGTFPANCSCTYFSFSGSLFINYWTNSLSKILFLIPMLALVTFIIAFLL